MTLRELVGDWIYWSVVAFAVSGAATWVISCVDVTVSNMVRYFRSGRGHDDV